MARPTVRGPWKIQREEGVTTCDDAHPVRLPRHPEPPRPGDYGERAEAIRRGKRGYLCPGGQEHGYPCWIVFDSRGPVTGADEMFTHYLDAVNHCDELNSKEAADAGQS